MNKKNVKSKRSKLSEEKKREQIAAALKRKKECEQRALEIVSRLTEETATKEWFLESIKFINQEYYDDIVTERSIVRFCGYPTCPKQINPASRAKFHISIRDKKVYDREERSKFCSGFCFKASIHLKSQLETSPLWIREDVTISNISFLEENQSSQIGSGKGEEVELVVMAKLPPEGDLNGKQVVILENMDEDGEIRIKDAESGDHLYSTAEQELEKNKPKSILKKTPSDQKVNKEINFESSGMVTKNEPNSHPVKKDRVKFNSEYTGLREQVKEKVGEPDPEQLFQQDLDNLSAKELIEAMQKLKQLPSNIKVTTNDIEPLNKKEVLKVDITACEKLSSEVAVEVLLEWLTPASIRLLLGHTQLDQNNESGDEEDDDVDDITEKASKILLNDDPKFEMDSELVQQAQIFSTKFESFMKGKETYEDIKEIEDNDEEPCLPLLDHHAQTQHRIHVLLDQLSRFGGPIFQLLGLPNRPIEAELRRLVRSMNLTAKNVSLKPLEWRIIAIILSHMISENDEELSQVLLSTNYQKNLEILIQEFGLSPGFLNKTKQNICDISRFTNKS